MLILVTGGSGSGKSAYAEARVSKLDAEEKYYIATMQVYDEEGQQKVLRHRQMRAALSMTTIEQQRDIHMALSEIKTPENAAILLECMSNLLSNEMFTETGMLSGEQAAEKIITQMKELLAGTKHQVVVTNNVFEDGVQYEEETLSYMRALGRINAVLAELADEVVEIVVGIPVPVK